MKQKMTGNGAAGMLQRERNQFSTKLAETALFLQELVKFPREVGAILPSSKGLSNAMAEWLPGRPDEFVLELGPGTGSVTAALIKRGLRENRLIAIEQSPRMADLLRARFPKANIITGDAFQLDTLLKTHARKVESIGSVFSSLPLLNFEPAIAENLALKIRSILPTGGRLVQYSYKIGDTQPKAANHFRLIASNLIWLNIPPARVSAYQK